MKSPFLHCTCTLQYIPEHSIEISFVVFCVVYSNGTRPLRSESVCLDNTPGTCGRTAAARSTRVRASHQCWTPFLRSKCSIWRRSHSSRSSADRVPIYEPQPLCNTCWMHCYSWDRNAPPLWWGMQRWQSAELWTESSQNLPALFLDN